MATHHTAELSDQHLVEACLKHDSQGWELLLQRYKRLILSVPVRLQFGYDDRHEVFQNVCLEILKNMSSLRDTGKLRSWILTITIRQCKDFLRRKYMERERIGAAQEIPAPEPSADPQGIYLAVERKAVIREALDEMPQRSRTLLELLFFTERPMDYSAAAAAIGLSKDSIGCIRLRCLDKLKHILKARNYRS